MTHYLPCKDCICFPICLNRYRNHRLRDKAQTEGEDRLSKTLARLNLKQKCSILTDKMEECHNVYGLVQGEFNDLFEQNPSRDKNF